MYRQAIPGKLCELAPKQAKNFTGSRRAICHKSALPQTNAYRWPYETTSYGFHNFFRDPFTKKKFTENSKVIQVEGNIACGKQEFAKALAEKLGMAYFPPVNIEDLYINKAGFDYRAMNPLLAERLRHCDMDMFHEDPARHSAIHLQYHLFRLRAHQYLKALRHIFNTGEGVVLTRTPFTELAVVEAMHNVGWLPRGYLRGDGVQFYDWRYFYLNIRNLVLADMLKPHLTIYLDTPVETCLERAKQDPNPAAANSKAHTKEFLEELENVFRDVVLPKQEHNMHVMVVDHPEDKSSDEIEDVVDDISKLNFEHDVHDTQFETWFSDEKYTWYFHMRRDLTTKRCLDFFENINVPHYDIAGLGDSITDIDLKLRMSLYGSHVGPYGYDVNLGDSMKVVHKNPLKAIFGYLNFGESVDKHMRVDYA